MDAKSKQDFTNYQRLEVQARTKYLVIANYLMFLVTGLLFLCTTEPGEARDTLGFFNLQIMPIVLTMTLCYCATKKDIKFVEL